MREPRASARSARAPAHARARELAALAVLLALAACEREVPNNTRGAVRGPRGAGAPAVVVEEPASPSASRSRSSATSRRPSPAPSDPRPSGGAAPSEASERTTADLSAALARAFGTPTRCISPATRERLEDRLTVQVQVSVTPTGIVTRADVSSSQLAREDLECMRIYAERLRLGPIPDAPRTITTSVEYAVASGRVEAAQGEAPAAPRVPGSVSADRTLPAAGTETGRPAGAVPPSHTLPAQTEAARPPGFVPPSHTLPAQVE